MRRWNLILLALALSLSLVPPARPAEPDGLVVTPDRLRVGVFFAGQLVTISGRVEEGAHMFLEIKGPRQNARFDLKGRFGPFWMTRRLVEVDQAPVLYALLLPAGDWADRASALGIGLKSLEKTVTVKPDGPDSNDLFDHFVKFKIAEGLYVQSSGAVTYGQAEAGQRTFRASFTFPPATAPGRYWITAAVWRPGRAAGRIIREYRVEESDIIKTVREMASRQGLIYGLVSVLLALMAGVTMGLVFRGGKGGH